MRIGMSAEKKKPHDLKVEFTLRTLLRAITWETASQIAPWNCSKELREEPGYIGVFDEKNTCCQTVLFYLWDDARVWAH